MNNLNRKDGLVGLFASGMFGNATDTYFITWCYDNDGELFLLQCLVDRIRDISPFASIKFNTVVNSSRSIACNYTNCGNC